MFENQTEIEIKNRMLSKAPEGINTLEGDFFNDAVSPAAIEFTLAYQELDNVLKLGFVESSYGEWLEKITSERCVYRKPATKGQGLIEVSMTPGSVIKEGDILATSEGNIRFVAIEGKTIGTSGKEQVNFENEQAGNFGSILTNTSFIAPISIPGFLSAKNLLQINAGTNKEDDDSLRERYYEVVRMPATSGNKHHYRKWAKEVEGIGDAKVFPCWDGEYTVKVAVIDANKLPASAALVADVQEHIDPGAAGLGEGEAPIGAKCTVVAAEGLNINVSATINGADPALVKADFEESLENYLKEIAFVEPTVSFAKIGSMLMESIAKFGGTDYVSQSLLVNGGAASIQIGEGQVAVKGTVVLS